MTMTDQQVLVRILLVEDNDDDIFIARKALKAAKMVNELYVVHDGEEALNFLQHLGAYQDLATSPRPGLILLDINMPRMNGLEVLKFVKQQPELKRIPVVLLTSSKREQDVEKGYEHGCNSFLQKPVEFERFVELVTEIGLYWGLLNITPPE